MAAPYPGPYGPPPHVDPRELRPSRAWFWVGGALIPIAIILGVVLFIIMIIRALALPDFEARTQGAQSTTFTVDAEQHPEDGWLLYGSPSSVDHTACALSDADGQPHDFTYPTFNHEVDGTDGSWAMIGMATLTEPGEYTLACDAPEDVRFGLAYGDDTTGGILGNLFGALGSFLLIPFLGIVGGVLIIIVTAVRRGRHRQLLRQERMSYPGYGPYPGPQPPPYPPHGGQPPQPPGPSAPPNPPDQGPQQP